MTVESVKLFRRQLPAEAPRVTLVDPLLGRHQALQEREVPFNHVEVNKPLRRPCCSSTLLGTLFAMPWLTVGRP
jgi:hypothetical protein